MTVDVHVDRTRDGESAVVLVPPVVADLDAGARAHLARDVITATLGVLAGHRQWSLVALDGVRSVVDEAIGAAEPALPFSVVATTGIPSGHEIRSIGGGPTNGVPRGYLDEVERLVQAGQTTHLDWWRAADRLLLEISYEFRTDANGPSVRRRGGKLDARIRRDPRSLAAAPDPAAVARADVGELLELVGRTMSLGPCPPLD